MTQTGPFQTIDELRELFYNRAGSRLADHLTYIPTGRMVYPSIYSDDRRPYLSMPKGLLGRLYRCIAKEIGYE